jgi:hypothetical protein
MHVTEAFPERAGITNLNWAQDGEASSQFPGTGTMVFNSDEWWVRAFDDDLQKFGNRIDITLKNEVTAFRWEGYVEGETIEGWVSSGGLVPAAEEVVAESGWLEYTNERYGYRFSYPPDASVFEMGVEWFEIEEKPDEISNRDFFYVLYERLGQNLCVRVELGDGYILFDPPENHTRYNYCRRYGQRTGKLFDRSQVVTIAGEGIIVEGKEFLQTGVDNPERDDTYAFSLDSGMYIEFGAYSFDGAPFEEYRQNSLPILIQILATYEMID